MRILQCTFLEFRQLFACDFYKFCCRVGELDAKFSTPYAVAAAFLYGKVSMAEFEPQVVKDPAVQTLLAKVDVAADDRYTSQYPKHWGCEMKVTMKDGRVYCYEVQDPSGSTARPLTRKQVMEKAETLLHAGYAGREQEVIHQLFSLEHAKQMPVLGQ